MTLTKWRRASITAFTALALPLSVLAIPQSAHASPPQACLTRTPSDFNGDGYADLAIGESERSPHGFFSGAVQVDYGSATGIDTTKTQFLTEDAPGPGQTDNGDYFGAALASGYFNGDCYADLAVAATGDDNGLGTVTVLYGGPNGLTDTGYTRVVGKGLFGVALATGDFNGDGFDDLAADSRSATDDAVPDAGAVGILYGGSAGLGSPTWLMQSSPGMPGAAEQNDEFGSRLAAGDFNGDGRDDLAIGTPSEADGSVMAGGAVTVVYGGPSGLSTKRAMAFTQSSAGIPGSNELHDNFGEALAAGDVNGDGRADLLIGVQKSFGKHINAGEVLYLPGSGNGVTSVGTRAFTQDSPGIFGSVGRTTSSVPRSRSPTSTATGGRMW